MFAKIKAFFAAVPGSVKGQVNSQELFRAIFAGVAGGSSVGYAVAILTSISHDASHIFATPSVASLAVSVVGIALDVIRRRSHGQPKAE